MKSVEESSRFLLVLFERLVLFVTPGRQARVPNVVQGTTVRNPGGPTVFTSKDGGATWTQVKLNDDESCASHMIPDLVVDPKTGKVHVFWIENRTGKGDAVYAVCDAGGAACGANERISDEPFASYSLSRHSNRWLGEYNSFVLDDKRRVLHAVWAQTVDEGDGPTGRIFHASAKLP